jgi:hypothetical protein
MVSTSCDRLAVAFFVLSTFLVVLRGDEFK